MSEQKFWDIPVLGIPPKPVEIDISHPLKSYFDEYNRKYAFVMVNGATLHVFNYETGKYCDLQSLKILNSEKVTIPSVRGTKEVKPFDVWVDDKHARRNFEDSIFYPGEASPKAFNAWQGWGVQPFFETSAIEHEQYVQPWLNFIKNIFCSGNDKQNEYLLNWLAHLVQKPHEKPGVAVVLQSGQGYGKGMFATLIQDIVGLPYTMRVSDSNQVAGGFSGHMADKLFIMLDEATWGGDKKSQGRLKAVVTEFRLTIEGKHQAAQEITHYARFLIASNNSYPIPIEHDDRRFFVPDLTPHRPKPEVFDPLWLLLNDIEKKSARHFMNYLLRRDLSNFKIQLFPHTDKRRELQIESASHNDVYLSFIMAAYEGEELAVPLLQTNISASALYTAFDNWKRNTAFKSVPTTQRTFSSALKKAGIPNKHTNTGTTYQCHTSDIEAYLTTLGWM